MSENIYKQLNCQLRESFGSSNARRLRKSNTIPGIIYKSDGSSIAVSFSAYDLLMIRKNGLFLSTPIHINLNDHIHLAIPKSVQVHPIKETVTHIEFILDDGEDKILEVPIFYENLDKSPGHKRSGFFNITQRTIKIKGKIKNMPNILKKDVSHFMGGMMIKANEIDLPEGYVLAEKDAKKVIAVMAGRGASKTETTQAVAAPTKAKK
ncbi:MAG: 50S ribosomal protein L25 [Rickettsiales bacterium]